MKPVKIIQQSRPTFHTGNGTAGVAASTLTSNNWLASYYVRIRNHDGANSMYVGLAGVTSSNGFRLDAGDDIEIPVDDPRLIYVIRATADVAYSFLVI
jgi:hypothetical protein